MRETMRATMSDSDTELPEYQSLVDGRGVVKLADWTCVTLRGADRATFLHNFCTNDIKRLKPGDGCEAFITDVKGKVLGHVLVACAEEQLMLLGVPGQAEAIISHLDRYIVREDVELCDTTGENACLLTTRPGATDALRPGAFRLVVRCDWLRPVETALVVVDAEDVETTCQQLVAEGVTPCSENAFTTARIESGMPWFGVDFNASNLPQEVGRDRQAISFTKGCYLGQETIARIDALGHVNQQIVAVVFESAEQPPPECELAIGGEVVGKITSIVFSPRLQRPLGLAMVRRQHNSIGSQLESVNGKCEVVTLPPKPGPAAV